MSVNLYECPHCSVIMGQRLDKCPVCKRKLKYVRTRFIDAPEIDTDD